MTWIQIRLNVIALTFVMISSPSSLHAQTAAVVDELQAQKDACTKNTAMTWDFTMNRCVGKVQARAERHEAQDCNLVTDIEARKACHMNVATKKTGVTSDPEKAGEKISSLQSRSAMINGATSVVSLLNMFASKKAGSSCMSKSIMGITALGGIATDIYFKIQTKKKLNALKDKFQLDLADSAYNAQVKALVFLKEEQEVVKKIASMEKKRQMLLMLGYGAAAVAAGYESFTNAACWNKEADKPTPAATTPPPAADATNVAATTVKPGAAPADPFAPPAEGVVVGQAMSPGNANPVPLDSQPPPVTAATSVTSSAPVGGIDDRNGMDVASDNFKKYDKIESVKDGSYMRTIAKDSNGNVVGVVHNGQMYEKFSKSTSGQYMAQGKPSGVFDYNAGSYKGVQFDKVAVTTNYFFKDGKVLPGSGTAELSKVHFKTNITQKSKQ